jgi:subtilisin family serine protease
MTTQPFSLPTTNPKSKGEDGQYGYPQLRQGILNHPDTQGQADSLKIWHFITKEVYTNPQYAATMAATQQRWRDAVARAASRDILVVKSAGNAYDETPPELTSWEDRLRFCRDFMWAPQMVMVGATDGRGRPTEFSTPGTGRLDDGTSPQIAMRGSEIALSPGARQMNPGWRFAEETEGTSFAAPQVTGVVARMEEIARAAGRDLTPDEIRSILFRSTTPVTPPVDRLARAQTGHGILSPELAYTNTTAYLNETR